ncbi:NAD(P)-dependent oxidoreductase [Cupriavidus sp. TMH.W2]|uniref:NAD(P)-dependent oxidoreductase n=1 Tax=Cupriavidus sp. TMH.W2 TaxID=3434465 RepID=UPI003D78A246
MKVSVIGLGAMGTAMAANLLKAGHEVWVWNRSPAAADTLVAAGAIRCATAAEAFAGAPVVMSVLGDDAAVEQVITAEVLRAASKGAIHINLATVSVAAAQRLAALHAQHHLTYIGAPVFGRADMAAAGKLNIVAGGPAAAIETVQPLFSAIGQRVWPVGEDPVHAHLVKIAGNFMIACVIETLGEAMAMVEKSGLPPKVFTDIMTGTLFAAPAYNVYADLINAGTFQPAAFKLHLGLKDVGLALAAAHGVQAPLPLGSVLRDHFLEAMASGHGQHDWAFLGEQIRRKAGLPARHDAACNTNTASA